MFPQFSRTCPLISLAVVPLTLVSRVPNFGNPVDSTSPEDHLKEDPEDTDYATGNDDI